MRGDGEGLESREQKGEIWGAHLVDPQLMLMLMLTLMPAVVVHEGREVVRWERQAQKVAVGSPTCRLEQEAPPVWKSPSVTVN